MVYLSVQTSQIEIRGSFICRRQLFEPSRGIFSIKKLSLTMKNTEAGEKKGVRWLNFQLVETHSPKLNEHVEKAGALRCSSEGNIEMTTCDRRCISLKIRPFETI